MTYNYEDGASAGDARYVRLSSVEYPDGRNVFYIYPSSGIGDALSRVEAIAGDAAGATRFAEYAYLGAGTIVSVAHPAVSGGLTLDYNPSGNADGNPNDNYSGWDRFGRVVDQRWTDGAGTADLDRYSYTYDGNSNRTSRTNLVETNGVLDEDYTYDGLNRLVDTNRNGTDLQSWNLDSLGNWSSFTDEGTTETRTHNAANEIQNISSTAVPPEDAVSPEFDAAGNMISGPRPDDPLVRQHYIYDAWNRLVEVRADNPVVAGSPGDAIATFEYDGRNFRIGKTVGGVLEAFYYNEGSQVLEVRKDGDIDPSEQYVWDLRYIDAPILRATPGEVLYYANDANFNVTALVDAATGLVVERYHYDPYGEVLFMDADWTPIAASAYDNAVLYTGRRLDAETGLFYYWARYYDATLGRFIHRDPIGYAAGDDNLYSYVLGSPLTNIDPLGLWTPEGLLRSYTDLYGEEMTAKLLALMSSKNIRIDGACTYSDDWYVEGKSIVIATTQWFGSERGNDNAAMQLNEALAIEFNLGSKSFFYKVGRTFRGTGKMVGGGLTAGVALGLDGTGVGLIIGLPLGVFGSYTFIEGTTQLFGLGEGEGGWNPGAEAAGAIGQLIGGDSGARSGRNAYYMADFAVSLAGGIGAIKNIGSIKKFEFVAKYKVLEGRRVYQYASTGSGGTIVQQGFAHRIPWKLRVTGHSIEAVTAGHAVIENIVAGASNTGSSASLGGMSAQEAQQVRDGMN